MLGICAATSPRNQSESEVNGILLGAGPAEIPWSTKRRVEQKTAKDDALLGALVTDGHGAVQWAWLERKKNAQMLSTSDLTVPSPRRTARRMVPQVFFLPNAIGGFLASRHSHLLLTLSLSIRPLHRNGCVPLFCASHLFLTASFSIPPPLSRRETGPLPRQVPVRCLQLWHSDFWSFNAEGSAQMQPLRVPCASALAHKPFKRALRDDRNLVHSKGLVCGKWRG